MKKLTLLLTMTFAGLTAQAQNSEQFSERIVIPLTNPGQLGTLEVNQVYGGIKVTGYEGDEVVVVAKQKRVQSSVKMKNGLRRIENNSLALEAEESDNYVEVHSQNYNSSHDETMHLEIQIPKHFNLKLSNVNNGDTWVEGVSGEMEISNVNGSITLNQVSGSAVVDSVNGEVKAVFTSVTPDRQLMLTSFNGNVDLTIPANTPADFKLKTGYGEIYTGFDIEFDTSAPVVEKENSERSYKVKIEKWVTGRVNGGGTEVVLKSHSGDLIVRAD